MEVLTLLETIEEMLERSANIPLTKKSLVDKDEILALSSLPIPL